MTFAFGIEGFSTEHFIRTIHYNDAKSVEGEIKPSQTCHAWLDLDQSYQRMEKFVYVLSFTVYLDVLLMLSMYLISLVVHIGHFVFIFA